MMLIATPKFFIRLCQVSNSRMALSLHAGDRKTVYCYGIQSSSKFYVNERGKRQMHLNSNALVATPRALCQLPARNVKNPLRTAQGVCSDLYAAAKHLATAVIALEHEEIVGSS